MAETPLPLRRYLLTLPIAAAAFMGLAILDQRETFLAAWGFSAGAPVTTGPTQASAEAEETVRAFNRVLERCYADLSVMPLRGERVAPELVRFLEAEISHPEAGGAARGMRLTKLSFVQVEPAAAGGWSLTTDETWGWDDPARRPSRLRFRYRLAAAGGGLRVEEMTPVLPEPAVAAAR